MKFHYLLLALLTALTISACDQTPNRSHIKHPILQRYIPKTITRTVSWFLKHDAELDDTLKLCQNNPGELHNDPECINAQQAANQRSAGELHPLHIDVDKLPKHHGWN
ncbi:hypothetical protein SOPP22_01525 [Shewanella sp. OPT22]|nr:hypothetical protein SOPP22_01525 [Shewanella sp. OPT22]